MTIFATKPKVLIMAFEKGHKKFGGSKPGAQYQFKGQLRQLLGEYAIEHLTDYQDSLEQLRLKDTSAYVRAYNDLLKHILPALQSVSLDVGSTAQTSFAQALLSLSDRAEGKTEDKDK